VHSGFDLAPVFVAHLVQQFERPDLSHDAQRCLIRRIGIEIGLAAKSPNGE